VPALIQRDGPAAGGRTAAGTDAGGVSGVGREGWSAFPLPIRLPLPRGDGLVGGDDGVSDALLDSYC